ncbi:MAG: peptidylprolyl isomerase [Caulobacterales bacterium]
MSPSVVIEGVEIAERLIAEESQHHLAANPAEARLAAARALATKALLLDRAHHLGLTADPDVDDQGRAQTDEEALISAVLDAEVCATAPTETECRRFYDSRRASFASPALYEASHILFAPASDDQHAWEAARAAADRVLALIEGAKARWEILAQTHSDCPSGAAGGSLGQLQAGDLASEVEAALDRLAPGEIAAEPVRSRFGWHILKVERRIDARQLPFEAVRDWIARQLEGQAWTTAAARYVAGLAQEARAGGVALKFTPEGAVQRPAVSLGDLLGQEGSALRLPAWLEAVDPPLAAMVAQAAETEGLSTPQFVRRAASQFVEIADDAAWTGLISAARDADDPALAGLTAILRSRLAPPRRTVTLVRRIGRGAAVGGRADAGARRSDR